MKKKKKNNVVHLNKKKQKASKRLEKKRERKLLEDLVHDFFYTFDPNPPIGMVKSSRVFEEFSWWALTPCSFNMFSRIADKYVRKEKGRDGLMYYQLQDHVLAHILSHRDDFEMAA